MTTLESAIPFHLATDRTFPVKTSPNYQPSYPGYSATFPQSCKDLVMAIIGAQHPRKPDDSTKNSALPQIQKFFDATGVDLKPTYVELACGTDNQGFYNEAAIAYWPTIATHELWASTSGFNTWFDSLDPTIAACGWFKEIFLPSIDRFETVFSDSTTPEGAAYMREGMSGAIREHAYWGSMRDRFAVTQTDTVEGEKWDSLTSSSRERSQTGAVMDKRRIKVPGRRNLAIIRSGQDWSCTSSRERALYLETQHPVLMTGMNFLRDQGHEVGCFSCRFWDVLDKTTFEPHDANHRPIEKTFGLAYFDDLASLEGWSKSHKTHLDIFGRFLQYARELGPEMKLKLFHEVMVLESGQQKFEYVGCHGGTGMLAGM